MNSALEADIHTRLLVLGAGPGGYAAAFRAADLGLDTVLVERHQRLGGVCLNVGCIPSKALLHAAKVLSDAQEAQAMGITFGPPEVDLQRLRRWKGSVVERLTGGLATLAGQRQVRVLSGEGRFESARLLSVRSGTGITRIAFEECVLAPGSVAARLPGLPYDDPRVMDSTQALDLADMPGRLLVIGGGIIGLELATVYDALGSRVTVVELAESLIPGCDPDLVRPLARRIADRYEAIVLGARVGDVSVADEGLRVTFAGPTAPPVEVFDRILVAVGRRPGGGQLAEGIGVHTDSRGFITVDEQMRTNVPHVFAVGDAVGEPMLAHKASAQGKVAAEVIAGTDVAFDAASVPSVAYTDPEVAWTGLTEAAARAAGVAYQKATFPWVASGRALSLGRPEGLTKLLFDPASHRVLGVGIVGVNAGELIAEAVLMIEMGADVQDVALSVHPHPTLSETVGFSAEVAQGTITDLYAPRPRAA